MDNLGKEYLSATIKRLKYYKHLGEKTFEQLKEKDFHWQPSSESNSIAVIMQHLAGNMLSRFTNFLDEDGEKEWRQHDDEFEQHFYSRDSLMKLWNKGWDCLLDSLESLSSEDLLKIVYVRREGFPAIEAINYQFAHYAYHIAQIVYVGKLIKNENWKNLSTPKRPQNNTIKFQKQRT